MADEQTSAPITGADAAADESADDANAEADASVDADDGDDNETPTGRVENTTPPPHESETDEEGSDETVPTVELDLYDLSVRVSGQSTDDLDAVGDTARELMDYLVERAQTLEDRPDDRGLS